jgi:hypothetical protein
LEERFTEVQRKNYRSWKKGLPKFKERTTAVGRKVYRSSKKELPQLEERAKPPSLLFTVFNVHFFVLDNIRHV